MKFQKAFFAFLLLFIAVADSAFSDSLYFYKKRNFGSEALYNPINMILNGSFDIIQLDGHSRRIFPFPYKKATENVFRNLANPIPAINNYGWGNLLTDEVLPIHIFRKGAQWWPNYQLHLIGGGMTYTMTKEWFQLHNFNSPELYSIGTMFVYHFLNEVVENAEYSSDNAAAIADFYIFDVGGIILFSSPSVNKFFSEELNLADWSLQPSFSLPHFRMHNNGQYFSIKWKLPFSEKYSLFYYFGMNGLAGLSYTLPDATSLSFGAGLRAKELVSLNEPRRKQTVTVVWNSGIFYDKDNSLLASLFFSGLTDYTTQLNIYPGVLRIENFSPGVWCVLGKKGNVLFGITTVWLPGVAVE
ncbi:MAG: hypothetical protein AAB071_07105 [Bacteroidota bacterium]